MGLSKLAVILIITFFIPGIFTSAPSSTKHYFYRDYFLNLDTLKQTKLKSADLQVTVNGVKHVQKEEIKLIGQTNTHFILTRTYELSSIPTVEMVSKKDLRSTILKLPISLFSPGNKITFTGGYFIVPMYLQIEVHQAPALNGKNILTVRQKNQKTGLYELRGKKIFETIGLSHPVIYKNRLFGLIPDKGLFTIQIDPKKSSNYMATQLSKASSKDSHHLIPDNSGPIHIIKPQNDNLFLIRKYDERAKLLFDRKIKHTHIKIAGGEHYYFPYLRRLTETADYLIFTSYDRNYPVTTIVHRVTGRVRDFPYLIAGVVRDSNNNFQGFTVLNKKGDHLSFYSSAGQLKWRAKVQEGHGERLKGHWVDNQLIFTRYHKIATGSDVFSLHIKTVKLLWRGDVRQLKVSHSKYLNGVNMTIYRNKVILQGIEMDRYLQVLDASTGRNLFSDMR
ncbi:MAG: PQQ-like beta-propeller repeat protein [Spirochaetota bacterium]|nr:PQQ-like beta-propeller repeat protein [Spirochaetota bacterium]